MGKPLNADNLRDKARLNAARLIAEAKAHGEYQAELAEILFNKKEQEQ